TTGFTPGATPMVTLSGGGGTGATANAKVDNSGNLTVTITNPGTGYTGAPTVAFTGLPTGFTTAATSSLNAGNSSGGLPFQGFGTTTLSGANTYTGTTNITAGKVVVTGSLAGTGAVNLSTATSSPTLDGIGSVGNLTVGNGSAILQNGN